jgi:hypothetical protein
VKSSLAVLWDYSKRKRQLKPKNNRKSQLLSPQQTLAGPVQLEICKDLKHLLWATSTNRTFPAPKQVKH